MGLPPLAELTNPCDCSNAETSMQFFFTETLVPHPRTSVAPGYGGYEEIKRILSQIDRYNHTNMVVAQKKMFLRCWLFKFTKKKKRSTSFFAAYLYGK